MPTPTDIRKKALALQGRIRANRKTPSDPNPGGEPLSVLLDSISPPEPPTDPCPEEVIGLLSHSTSRPKGPIEKALDIALETMEDRQRQGGPPSPICRTEDAARKLTERLASTPQRTLYGMGKDLIVARLKSMQGRILTIVDASFQDPEQRKAVKTLVSKEFRLEMGRVSDFFGDDEGYED